MSMRALSSLPTSWAFQYQDPMNENLGENRVLGLAFRWHLWIARFRLRFKSEALVAASCRPESRKDPDVDPEDLSRSAAQELGLRVRITYIYI